MADAPADRVAAWLVGARFDAERQGLTDEQAAHLLAAVEKVLLRHQVLYGQCKTDHERWPCTEYQAISSALLGEEAGGG